MKISSYVESYEHVKVHDGNAQAFAIYFFIRSHTSVIQERVYFSHELFCTLEFGHSVFTRVIVLRNMIQFRESFKFDI